MKTSRGFLQIVLIIVIALIVLGYFGLNIREILEKPIVHDNLLWFWDFLKDLWTNYLKVPAEWVWEHVILLLWDLFKGGLGDLEAGSGPSALMNN